MTTEKKKGRIRTWAARAGASAAVALLFGGTLFLGVPAFIGDIPPMKLTAVDPQGWKPQALLELPPPDSLRKDVRTGGASLYLRFDASAPATVAMVMNNVIKDGSEERDTVMVSLGDEYGRPAGKHGYVLSEITVALQTREKTDECRLVEVYPADTVCGIHAVGILPR